VLLALIPAFINWGIALYALFRLPKSATTYLFILFVSSLGLWQTSDALMRLSSTIQTATAWSQLLDLSILLSTPLGLHFLLFFTREEKLATSPIVLFLLYAPVILLDRVEKSGMVNPSIPTQYVPFWGWISTGSTMSFMEGTWIAGVAAVMILALILYAFEIWKIPQKRNQVLLIVAGLAIPTIQGAITEVIFPNILHLFPIPISSTVATTFSIATIIAMTKFNFLKITPAIASDTIVNTISDFILIVSPEGVLDFMSQESTKLFHINQSKVQVHQFEELIPPDPQEINNWKEKVIKPVRKGATIKDITCYFATPEKKNLPVLVSAAPIFMGSQTKQSVLIVAHDITNRIEMEENLKRSNQQLEKEKAILTSIGDGVIATDINGEIIFLNKTAQNLLGFSHEEAIGKRLAQLVTMMNEKGEKIPDEERPITQAIKTMKTISTSAYYVKKDKKIFPVSFTVSPIILNKSVLGTMEIFRDVTREKEIDQAKTEFVSLASHQLRTPPTTIKWYAELIMQKKTGILNDQQKKYIDVIHRESLKMISLVNALLNVSRLELGTFAVIPEPVTLATIINQTLDDFETQLTEKRISIKKTIDTTLPEIKLDSKLMQIILENIISNSIKYTAEKGRIEVKAQWSETKKQIIISIQDNGCGIPQNQQDKIFTKLFRASNAKIIDQKGTGLGLYIVKSIADQTGLKIRFISKENQGTTFFIELPLIGMREKEGEKYLD
jgi:PAS domain S-box-containing protein